MSLADQQWCPTSVQVTVLQARGLRIKGKSGTNDAYAVMQVGKEKYQTSVAEKSVAPVWKEEAAFDLPQGAGAGGGGGGERGTLHVHVLHRALVGPDKHLGQAVINLLQLSEDKTRNKTEWFKLLDKTGKADKDRGEVLLDIQFMRNNMTSSMFDLTGAGKSRSRLGKLKDKVSGKRKDSYTVSVVGQSFTQVMSDSEDDLNGDEEAPAGKYEKKKKLKVKSLFSPKSNLQKNMSQSMSVLPGKNSLSSSQSSGLNVDPSDGKKKFKFKIHKRSGSESKESKHGAVEQSNVCINGSHVYCEEPQSRASRIGSNFSLASSGHGSMEDVPESPPSTDSLMAVKQTSPWTVEEEDTAEADMVTEDDDKVRQEEEERIRMEKEEEERRQKEEEEEKLRQEEALEKKRQEEEEERKRMEEEEKLRKEEEEQIQREEEERRMEEKRRLEEEERIRKEEERRQEERARKEKEEHERLLEEKMKMEEQERRRIEEEEKRQKEEEERIRKEKEEYERLAEENRKLEEEKRQKEEEERIRKEEEKAQEERRRLEEQRRIEEEKIRKEEEERKQREEERRRKEEEEIMRRQEEEWEKRRLEEQGRKQREEEERIRKEEERARKEKEEYERLAEENRKLEEEKRQKEEDERAQEERRRLEEQRRIEEEKIRKEEEVRKQREEERRRKEEEEIMRRQEEEERARKEKEEYERLVAEKERERIEAEDRIRREEEERIRMEEEKRKKEQEAERLRKEEEEREEKRRLEEQERRGIEEEQKRQREEEERIRKEDEKRKEEEERARKEKEEHERLAEEKRRLEEQEIIRKQEEEERAKKEREEMERLAEEKRRVEEEERIKKEYEEGIRREKKAEREKKEEDARKLKIKKVTYAEKQKKSEKKTQDGNKTAKVVSTNPFDEDADEGCLSAVSSVESEIVPADKSAQREKRQAPKPPGRNQAESRREQDVSARNQGQINKQSNDKDVKTASVPPQRSVKAISTLSKSQTDTKITQSSMQSSTAKGATSANKQGKRPAPSRPRSVEGEEPSPDPKTASSSDGDVSQTKQNPIVQGLNPFEDDEDENKDTATCGNTGSVQWPPPASKAADNDAKLKPSKLRAPPPPGQIAASTSSTLTQQNTDGGHVTEETSVDVSEKRDPLQETSVRAQSAGEEAEVNKEVPPATSRRLQPVKPLNSLEQQSDSVVQGNETQKKTMVNDAGLKGPYSQLTREELISLVLKQEKQLSDRDKKISELEEYIDNLLLRVMEEQPSILMSLSSVKKAV